MIGAYSAERRMRMACYNCIAGDLVQVNGMGETDEYRFGSFSERRPCRCSAASWIKVLFWNATND